MLVPIFIIWFIFKAINAFYKKLPKAPLLVASIIWVIAFSVASCVQFIRFKNFRKSANEVARSISNYKQANGIYPSAQSIENPPHGIIYFMDETVHISFIFRRWNLMEDIIRTLRTTDGHIKEIRTIISLSDAIPR
jgi:hypothetical protein